jgi:hypothetical protein
MIAIVLCDPDDQKTGNVSRTQHREERKLWSREIRERKLLITASANGG